MSSREASLTEYRDEILAPDDPRRGEVYTCGDMNVSLLRTKKGATIVLQHAVVTPRPYDRIFLLSGSRGAFRDYPPRLHLDKIAKPEEWLNPDDFTSAEYSRSEWEDPLWTHQGEMALKLGGHGGMDFLTVYRLLGVVAAGLLLIEGAVASRRFQAPLETVKQVGSVESVGHALFTDYLLAFEVTSVLLLAAVVGATVLAKKKI